MNRQEATDYVNKIREKFPNPVKASNINKPDEYCVGGACYLYKTELPIEMADHDVRFPGSGYLSDIIDEISNKEKDYLRGLMPQAVAIINANDDEDFEKAWEKLIDALSHKEEENESNG